MDRKDQDAEPAPKDAIETPTEIEETDLDIVTGGLANSGPAEPTGPTCVTL